MLVIIHSSAHYSDNPIHYHSLKRPYILIFVRQGVRWPANAVFQEKERERSITRGFEPAYKQLMHGEAIAPSCSTRRYFNRPNPIDRRELEENGKK